MVHNTWPIHDMIEWILEYQIHDAHDCPGDMMTRFYIELLEYIVIEYYWDMCVYDLDLIL